MATLTKRELVVRISNEMGMTQHQVSDIIQKALDQIMNTLAAGESVELRNFGVLEIRLTKERIGRIPSQPGTEIKIPEHATVKFKSSKVLKQRLSKLTLALKRKEERGSPTA